MYNIIGIAMTKRCSASCSFCCFGCSPKSTGEIEENKFMNLLEEIVQDKTITDVSFSGGECFLKYNLLKKGVRNCNINNI